MCIECVCGINPVLAARYAICSSHAPAELRALSVKIAFPYICTVSREREGVSKFCKSVRLTCNVCLCVCVIDRNSNRIVDFSRDIGYFGFDRSRSFFVERLYEKIIIIYIKKHNSIIVCSLWLNYN